MNRVKVSDNFFLDEFICPCVYNEHKEKSIKHIDNRLIEIAQFIRSKTGSSVIINNYWKYYLDNINNAKVVEMVYANKGIFKERGLRNVNTETGAKLSAHKTGQAIDVDVDGMTAYSMFMFAKDNKNELYRLGVRRIEHYSLTGGNSKGWMHLDTKGNDDKKIKIINLTSVVDVWRI